MKVQWGVHENVSFDDVWQQALDAKASQAQRVPLTDEQVSLAAHNIDDGDWNNLVHKTVGILVFTKAPERQNAPTASHRRIRHDHQATASPKTQGRRASHVLGKAKSPRQP
jgi:hypothetical protein